MRKDCQGGDLLQGSGQVEAKTWWCRSSRSSFLVHHEPSCHGGFGSECYSLDRHPTETFASAPMGFGICCQNCHERVHQKIDPYQSLSWCFVRKRKAVSTSSSHLFCLPRRPPPISKLSHATIPFCHQCQVQLISKYSVPHHPNPP